MYMYVYMYLSVFMNEREDSQDEKWSSGSKINKTAHSVLTAPHTLIYIWLWLKLKRYTKYIGIAQQSVTLSRGANIDSGYRKFG